MTLIALCVLTCGARETKVGCDPTPSCSIDDKRFAAQPKVDAGAPDCDVHANRCRADEIAAGGTHGCARIAGGEVLIWGQPLEPVGLPSAIGAGPGGAQVPPAPGQAGFDHTPVDAGYIENVAPAPYDAVQVAAGGAHSCARTRGGAVLCWGVYDRGQIDGVESPGFGTAPTRVMLDGALDIDAGGEHTCAVVARGVMCWGDARFGQSGREIGERVLRPGLVPGTEGAVEVATGVRHSCARLMTGRVLCWGELIDANGRAHARADAALVDGLDDAIEIDAGAGHTCALRSNGAIACWGDNGTGQLGDGSTRPSATPIVVAHLPRALHVSAGGVEQNGALLGHTCAVDTDFFVQCWGSNAQGQLGVGQAPDSARPLVVRSLPGESNEPYLANMIEVSAGGMHTCALNHRGRVMCWGDNSQGQLGTDDSPPFGRPVRAGQGFIRLGSDHL